MKFEKISKARKNYWATKSPEEKSKIFRDLAIKKHKQETRKQKKLNSKLMLMGRLKNRDVVAIERQRAEKLLQKEIRRIENNKKKRRTKYRQVKQYNKMLVVAREKSEEEQKIIKEVFGVRRLRFGVKKL